MSTKAAPQSKTKKATAKRAATIGGVTVELATPVKHDKKAAAIRQAVRDFYAARRA